MKPTFSRSLGTLEDRFQIGQDGPGLRRSSAAIQTRIADDSDYAIHEALTPGLLDSGNALVTKDYVAAAASVPTLSHLRYVDRNYAGSGSDGSIQKPYTTIQAAIDYILSIPAQNKIWWGVLVAPADYDEDIAFDGTNRQIAILGLGPWGLGTFDGSAGAPTGTARNINWSVSGPNAGGTQHSFMVGQYQAPSLGIGTHIAIQSITRISGRINVIDNTLSGGTTKTLIVNARVFDFAATGNSIDATSGAAPSLGSTNLWLFGSRFESAVNGPPAPGGILLQWAENSSFLGLINVLRFSRIQNCNIGAGMTITADSADTSPSGIVGTNFSGTFTGPANSLRLDGNTNYWFKTNAASLAGGATKTVQDDLVP